MNHMEVNLMVGEYVLLKSSLGTCENLCVMSLDFSLLIWPRLSLLILNVHWLPMMFALGGFSTSVQV